MRRHLVLAGLALVGCTTVGPDDERPRVDLPAQYPVAEAPPS